MSPKLRDGFGGGEKKGSSLVLAEVPKKGVNPVLPLLPGVLLLLVRGVYRAGWPDELGEKKGGLLGVVWRA